MGRLRLQRSFLPAATQQSEGQGSFARCDVLPSEHVGRVLAVHGHGVALPRDPLGRLGLRPRQRLPVPLHALVALFAIVPGDVLVEGRRELPDLVGEPDLVVARAPWQGEGALRADGGLHVRRRVPGGALLEDVEPLLAEVREGHELPRVALVVTTPHVVLPLPVVAADDVEAPRRRARRQAREGERVASRPGRGLREENAEHGPVRSSWSARGLEKYQTWDL